jgi:EAL domain-containing protein (putative c-di-GMP-specific phosphodiesterase class I)
MDMTVIAEGIEKSEELDFLRQLGCDQYQGFLSARPMLLDELESGHWLLPCV